MPEDDLRELIHSDALGAPSPSPDLVERSLELRAERHRRHRTVRRAAIGVGGLAAAIAVMAALATLTSDRESRTPESVPTTSVHPNTAPAPGATECAPRIRDSAGVTYTAEIMLETVPTTSPFGQAVLAACADVATSGDDDGFENGTPVETLQVEGLSPAEGLVVVQGKIYTIFLDDRLPRDYREEVAKRLSGEP